MERKKNIVILGAGFGGLRAARVIAKNLQKLRLTERYEIILIDRNDHHTFTPLLYEVATTSKETANFCDLHRVVAHKTASLIETLPITFMQKEVSSLDLAEGAIHFTSGEKLKCDYLLLAMGSEVNFFDVPGAREYALPLKTFLDALKIRDTIVSLAMDGKREIRILVAGGGSTGVEIAAELQSWCHELKEAFSQCQLDITLVEASSAILPGFDPRVVRVATKRLRKIGLKIITGGKITEVQERAAILNGESTPCDVLMWASGVRPPKLFSTLGLKTEQRGRIEVGEKMTCIPSSPDLKLMPHLYAIGDIVCVYEEKTGKPMPGVARAAIDQANVAAHNIMEEIKNVEFPGYKSKVMSYQSKTYPYILPVGGKYTIAKIGPFVFKGFLGWIAKGLVELRYLLSIMPIGRAFSVWFKAFRIFMQNDRLG